MFLHSSRQLDTVLSTIKYLFFYFLHFSVSFFHEVRVSLALKAYPTCRCTAVLSKIKWSLEVFGVGVNQPALERHLVAERCKSLAL